MRTSFRRLPCRRLRPTQRRSTRLRSAPTAKPLEIHLWSLSMKQFTTLLNECEAAIRKGHTREVASRLKGLSTHEVPRELRLPLANLCRRAGVIPLSGKLLSPLVHADIKR